ncbi:Uncharacterized protein HZ326_22198 [Fusarium oxysporum f. sp. albedinis]|nr:Uncharacterized protein HZ326_22198 [Fusarium oxysporum f. sp. albedinis]
MYRGDALDKVLVPSRAVLICLWHDEAAAEGHQGLQHWGTVAALLSVPVPPDSTLALMNNTSSKQSRCTSAVDAVWCGASLRVPSGVDWPPLRLSKSFPRFENGYCLPSNGWARMHPGSKRKTCRS